MNFQSRALKNLSTMNMPKLTEQFLKLKHQKDFLSFREMLRLGEYASNTYAVLLTSSKALSASECAYITSHPRTKTYSVLADLEKNGLVESMGSRPALFKALPLKKALVNYIRNEKRKIADTEDRLKQFVIAIESVR